MAIINQCNFTLFFFVCKNKMKTNVEHSAKPKSQFNTKIFVKNKLPPQILLYFDFQALLIFKSIWCHASDVEKIILKVYKLWEYFNIAVGINFTRNVSFPTNIQKNAPYSKSTRCHSIFHFQFSSSTMTNQSWHKSIIISCSVSVSLFHSHSHSLYPNNTKKEENK